MSNSFPQIDVLPYGQGRNKTAAVKHPRWSREAEKQLSADLLLAEVLLFITEYRRLKEREWLKWDGHPLSFSLSESLQFQFNPDTARWLSKLRWKGTWITHARTPIKPVWSVSRTFSVLISGKSDVYGPLIHSSLHEIILTPATRFYQLALL